MDLGTSSKLMLLFCLAISLSLMIGYATANPHTAKPPICYCSMTYRPVCGPDGITYGNADCAKCAGVVNAREGKCKSKKVRRQLDIPDEYVPAEPSGVLPEGLGIHQEPQESSEEITYDLFSHEEMSDEPEISEDTSRRSLSGDISRRSLSGDISERSLFGDISERSLSGDISRRSLPGDISRRSLVGDIARRSLYTKLSPSLPGQQPGQQCLCKTHLYDPVCANDGFTHANADCAIKCSSGVKKTERGQCDRACPACSKHRYTQPVCDSTGVVYGNRCFAQCFGWSGSLGPELCTLTILQHYSQH